MTTAVAPKPAAPVSAPATTGQHVHIIAPGETLMKLSRQYNKPLVEIAKANNIPPSTLVKVGDRIIIPGTRSAQSQPQAAARQTMAMQTPAAPAKPAPQVAQPKLSAPATQKVAK